MKAGGRGVGIGGAIQILLLLLLLLLSLHVVWVRGVACCKGNGKSLLTRVSCLNGCAKINNGSDIHYTYDCAEAFKMAGAPPTSNVPRRIRPLPNQPPPKKHREHPPRKPRNPGQQLRLRQSSGDDDDESGGIWLTLSPNFKSLELKLNLAAG